VHVSAELAELLAQLQRRLDGRIAILTGRSVAEVDQLLGSVAVVLGGHHGLETRTTGGPPANVQRPGILDSVVAELRVLEQAFPGVLVEDKPLGVALHYRQAPHAEDACRSAVEASARRSGLDMQPGKMVFELKPQGANKGDALRAMMAERPFAGTRPIFVGDDLTDEPAFAAAQDMGGSGIIVGDRAPTCAEFRVATVDETLAWLRQACELA
jgi:trehalose 6-phosphate phosphatase